MIASSRCERDLLLLLRHWRRRRLRADPSARAFQTLLAEEYAASLEWLLPIKARLAAADHLIDRIVRRLYGLTEEEIAQVFLNLSRWWYCQSRSFCFQSPRGL